MPTGTKTEDLHIHGAAEAERIITEEGYPRPKNDWVKAYILTRRGSVALDKVRIPTKKAGVPGIESHPLFPRL